MAITQRWPVRAALALAVLGWAAPAPAQEVKPGGREAITIRGILSATFFAQDAIFSPGNGQKTQFVVGDLGEDKWWHGGDARNMRVTLGFAGPDVVGNWKSNATFELDFFGAFPGAANFGDEQPQPRLRLAFADLTNGRTTIRFGQDWALTFGNIPVSTSHIGFPLGWGPGGLLGWRFLGVQLHQPLSKPGAATTAMLKLAVYKNSWSDELATFGGTADDNPSAGEAGMPQLEGRLDLSGKMGANTWSAYAVGHWDKKDLDGVGVDTLEEDMTSWALEGGLRFVAGRLTLHGNGYVGQNMGHHFGHIIQFSTTSDIKGWGAWGQAGLSLNPRWSVWGFFGTDNPDDEVESVQTGATSALVGRTKSWQFVPMLRFQSGQYSFGLEWLRNETTTQTAAGAQTDLGGNEILASVVYTF